MRVYTAFAVFFLASPFCAVNAQDRRCVDWNAVVTSVGDQVEILRAGASQWEPAAAGTIACLNDSLSTGEFGWALVRLPNETSVRLQAGTVLQLLPPEDENRTWIELIRGLIHVISRDSRALKIATTYVNAGLKGTEFVIGVDGTRMDLSVFEGEVVLESPAARLSVSEPSRVSAVSGIYGDVQAAGREQLLWALYYPLIVDGDLPRPDQSGPGQGDDADFLIRRAQARLFLGQVAAAEADLAAARALRPGIAEASALSAMIMLVQGRTDAAADHVRDALASDPQSSAARLAESYLLEQVRTVQAAHAVVAAVTERSPDSALAAARLAELAFGIGDFGAARREARRALELDSGAALAYTVLGFLALPAGELAAAEASFGEAVRLDPGSPLPRFGLGQVDIRRNRLNEGREQLEHAVALHPNNALLRAYIARTYGDEGRYALVDPQFEISKALDETAWTPWLYEAVVAQEANRPIVAVRNLDRAAMLKGNESAFRSELYLDEDLGVRNAAFGEMYLSAGYAKGALLSGMHAATVDPDDFTGFQLLADGYVTVPRHQIARVDATLQAQIRRPLESQPFAPERSETAISLMSVAGPAPLTQAEPRATYAQNGLKARVAGISGGNDTKGGHAIVSALGDSVFFNLSYFDFETDGFRENTDFEHDVLSALIQVRPSIEASYLFELRSAATEHGDPRLLFDPANVETLHRQEEAIDSFRFGTTRRISPRTTMLGTFLADTEDSRVDASILSGHIASRTEIAELQILSRLARWRLTYGIRHMQGDVERTLRAILPGPDIGETATQRTSPRHSLAYGYASRQVGPRLHTTIGLSVDRPEGGLVEDTFFNQKLGLIWRPSNGTFVRAAAFRTTQGSIVSRQLVRPSLEPGQVAGFSQYFFAAEGERTDQYGIGVDHAFSPALRVGAEYRLRDIEFPTLNVIPPSAIPVLENNPVRESIANALVHWTPSSNMVVYAGYEYERFDHRQAKQVVEGYRLVRTRRLPVSVIVFAGGGLRAQLTGTHVRQSGEFELGAPGPEQAIGPGSSAFVVYDLTLGYRLPNRRGSIELGVRNLLDKEFRYQDTDPYNPRILPERFGMARFSLAF